MADLRSRLQQTTGSAFHPSEECLEVLAENADALVDRVCLAGSAPRAPVPHPSLEPRERASGHATSWLIALVVVALAVGAFLLVLSPPGHGAGARSDRPVLATGTAASGADVSASDRGVSAGETCSVPVPGLPGTVSASCTAAAPHAAP